MSHQIKCYPLGNADTSLVLLKNGKRILFDYANTKTDADDDKSIDLPAELNTDVENDFDVVAFTHADEDHVTGFSEYFFLEHDTKYQKGNRKKIKDIWVPAAVLLQKDADIKHDDGKLLKKEARYRLKNKSGIKVFSSRDDLQDWRTGGGLNYDEVKHLIVNAGQIVPDWSLENEGIEFFVHSPFAEHVDDRDIDRNEACIIVQAVFDNTISSKLIFGADGLWEVWNDIVDISKYFKRTGRLEWDIFHISHHSSYLSLNSEKGETKTVPTEQIKWLFETQGKDGSILVSPSLPIPTDYEAVQPPHRQAANYYEDVADLKNGEYKVTMEHPSKESPETLIIDIDDTSGATIIKATSSFAFVTNRPAPKAG